MDMTVEVPELPELTFDEASHIYRLNGDIIPSVSKLMEPLKDQCYGGTRTSALQTGRLSSQQRQSKSPERGSFSGRAERENCLRTRSKPAPDGACISMP